MRHYLVKKKKKQNWKWEESEFSAKFNPVCLFESHFLHLYHACKGFWGLPRWLAIAAAAAKLFQSCLTLCDPIDGSPLVSSVPGILQARTLEWGAIAFSIPGGLDSKESAYNAGDAGLIPGSGRSPEEGNGNALQYSCFENFTDRGTWQAMVQGVRKESDMTERLNNNKRVLDPSLSFSKVAWFKHFVWEEGGKNIIYVPKDRIWNGKAGLTSAKETWSQESMDSLMNRFFFLPLCLRSILLCY